MHKLILILLTLSSLIYGATCPRFDNSKTYALNDCVYFEGSGSGSNFKSEHNSNTGNPPGKSTWWWQECSSIDDDICKSQYTDTTFIDSTVYDTIMVYDTTFVTDTLKYVDTVTIMDTVIINDTITVIDTTEFIDTAIVSITLYDTVEINDTITVTLTQYDTISIIERDTLLIIDTIPLTINVYDTIISYDTITVYDTTSVMDTLYIDTVYNVTDTVTTLVPKDSLYNVGIEVPINDSFVVVGFEQYKINYYADGTLRDSPTFVVTGNVNNVSKGDILTIKIQAMVYDQLGQFVNRLDDEVTLVIDEYEDTYQFSETFTVIEEKYGHLRSFNGRQLGTGVYIVGGFVRILVNNKIKLSEEQFNKFGHQR